MKQRELIHLGAGIFILALVLSIGDLFAGNIVVVGIASLSAVLIVATTIIAKKMMANSLDADVEHEVWAWQRYGFKPEAHLRNAVPAGVILPILGAVITLGIVKIMTLFTYETTPLRRRSARRFGVFSFTEMTDWHTALIGAVGIVTALALSLVTYFIPGLEFTARAAAFYAFWNMLPFSKLDGAQIFFGSRVLYTGLLIVTLIFVTYALILV